MANNPLHAKVSDGELRRFAEHQEEGEKSVMIELNMPANIVTIGQRHVGGVRPSGPYRVSPPDDNWDKRKSEVQKLRRWLEDIGLSVRYLGASHVFLTKVTSNQLTQIVTSNKVRSVALNRRVKAL